MVAAYTFLLLNLAMSLYNVGVIWAHEVDIFRSWRLIPAGDFPTVQGVHWRKLPYWVFAPYALSIAGALALLAYHPDHAPTWTLVGNALCQVLALVLTAVMWAPWQYRLSRDAAGPRSRYLDYILRTHWIRTSLITAAGCFLLICLGVIGAS
jgi:hypothetical protein